MLTLGVPLRVPRVLRMVVVLLVLVRSNVNFAEKFSTTDRFGDAQAAKSPLVPAMVILGDSTVDVGVNSFLNTLIRSDWPPYGRNFPDQKPTGRFCDGKLAIDFVADRLGLPYPLPFLDPEAHSRRILTGINVASSGSGFLDSTAWQLSVVSMSQQISWVKIWQSNISALVGNDAAAKITSEALFIFSSGSNDWVNNYYLNPTLHLFTTPTQHKHQLLILARQHLQDLYDLGARKVVVLSLPPMGCVPIEIMMFDGKGKCLDFMNNDSFAFNAGLETVVNQFRTQHSKFIYLDIYSLIYDAFHNPTKYGIANTDTYQTCCETASLPSVGPTCNRFSGACEKAENYLFWDAYHPTEFFNRQIAEAFFSTVGEELGLAL